MREARPINGELTPASERLASPGAPPPTRDTRAFAQKRSRATYGALLDASASVFADKGFDATQTPDIARRAGVSVGTFYRYFADKRQAFIEMVQAYLEQSYESVMANLTPEAFAVTRTPEARRAAVNRVIDVLFRSAAERPELHFVVWGMSMRDADVARIRNEFDERGRDALAALIRNVVPRERIGDPRSAAAVIQIAAQEVAIATFGGRGTPRCERAGALRAALADMLYRYVFGG